jgi:hypothetical protein
MTETVLRFPAGNALAPHVIVAHHDISASGLRALVVLNETLAAQCGSERRSSDTGEVCTALATQSPASWEVDDAAISPLAVHTFRGTDGSAVLSLVCISVEIPIEGSNSAALDLIRRFLADSVITPPPFPPASAHLSSIRACVSSDAFFPNSCPHWQVKEVTIVAATLFTPTSPANVTTAHQLHVSDANSGRASADFPAFDAGWPIRDSLLSALVQLLRLEDGIAAEALLAPGHRLPHAVALGRPNVDTSGPDAGQPAAAALLAALQASGAGAPLKVTPSLHRVF